MAAAIREGPDLARRYFERALGSGRLAHAYLFLGPEGSGKRRFALSLAKALFCLEGSAGDECPNCRRIEHGNHPGVTVYGAREGKRAVDIETVRDLCERSHYARDHAFVAILEGADALTPPAANALLKTLEEPPGEFIMLLTANSSGGLIPTIVSRCHRILFPGPLAAGAGETGGEAGEVEAAALAELEDPRRFLESDVRQWLERAVPGGASGRERVRRLLAACVHRRRRELADVESPLWERVAADLEALLDLRQALDANVNPDLVLEALLERLLRRPG